METCKSELYFLSDFEHNDVIIVLNIVEFVYITCIYMPGYFYVMGLLSVPCDIS